MIWLELPGNLFFLLVLGYIFDCINSLDFIFHAL